ncbi:unnamed protein product [Penicillium nalgiovense]|nr:unnamed protein product [Penicillium nalgiovense]
MHLLSDLILRVQSVPAIDNCVVYLNLSALFDWIQSICSLPFGAAAEPGPSHVPSPLVMCSPG